MRNPYEVLGIKEGSSVDDVKKAYRELVKKYHPDKYMDNPLSELAEEKLREINDAYDYLMKNQQFTKKNDNNYQTKTSNNWNNTNNYSNNTTYADDEFVNRIKTLIQNGAYSEAQAMLDSFKVRNSSWYYLQGLLFLRRGWYDRAYTLLQRAVDMEPGNYEYRDTLNKLNNQYNQYNNFRTHSYNRGYRRDNDLCNLCTTLWIADCCCECMGGDCIACC